jgi:hypothetical protein
MHGWRDFLLHLFTITIGLLIALSLEGLVEWQHHRHLVHDAEASLHGEIKSNAADMAGALEDLHKEQDTIKHDVVVLKEIAKTGTLPKDSSMSLSFHIHTFDSVGWKTASATGALAYMPYDRAQEYADIYTDQQELADSETQAARDTVVALGPLMNTDDSDTSAEEAKDILQKVSTLEGQLLIVDSFMKGLDGQYRKFLAAHPG